MAIPKHRVQALAYQAYFKERTPLFSWVNRVLLTVRESTGIGYVFLTPLTSKLAPSKITWTRESVLAFHEIF